MGYGNEETIKPADGTTWSHPETMAVDHEASQVEVAVSHLRQRVQDLEGITNELYHRLEGVLRPVPLETISEDALAKMEMGLAGHSPLAANLRSTGHAFEMELDRLRALLDRLDV